MGCKEIDAGKLRRSLPTTILVQFTLNSAAAIRGQRSTKAGRVDRPGQALQPFDQAWTGPPDQIWIDALDMVLLDGSNYAPARALIDRVDVAAIARIFGQDDELRIGADHGLISHLGK